MFDFFKRESVDRRLQRLDDRVEEIERAFKSLELEWSNVYDKVRVTLAKVARRSQRLEEQAQAAETHEEPHQGTNANRPGVDELSARIGAWRAARGRGNNAT